MRAVLAALLLSMLFILSPAARLQAQEPLIYFEQISLDQGLSHGSVYSIVQDNRGFLWFGTQDGLDRYDGYEIQTFRHDPKDPNSLSNNNAGNLYVDRAGMLWIGTWGGGANRLDPNTGQVTRYLPEPDNPHSLSSNRVQTFFEDSAGRLWIGTAGGGLNKLDRETGHFTVYQHDPSDPTSLSNDRVWRIVEDQAGMLWVATTEGLNRFDPETGTFITYNRDPDDPTSVSDNEIRTVYVDRAGTLWVGTQVGLNRFDMASDSFKPYYHDPDDPTSLSDDIINAILEDGAGQLWIGTSRGGLNKFHPSSDTFTHYLSNPQKQHSLSYNDIRWIYEDASGVLWLATRGGGVNKFLPQLEKFTYFSQDPNNPNSLTNNDVRAIYKDKAGTIWIGTRGGGLNKFDSQGQLTVYQHDETDSDSLSSNDISEIEQTKDGLLWLGLSDGGLTRFDPQAETFTNYRQDSDDPHSLSNDDVSRIYEDPWGDLWIGTYGGGFNKFDRAREQFTRYEHQETANSLSNDDVNDFYRSDEQTLWVATYGGGLNKFDLVREQFTIYDYDPDDPTSISNNEVYSIQPDDETNRLWLATNGGLNRFNPQTETATQFFDEADGLASNVVYAVLQDQAGNLWLSTNRGISKRNRQTGIFINYSSHDGLENIGYHEGAYHRSQQGEMFFGGINGLLQFSPADLTENDHLPPIVITDLNLPNRETRSGRPLFDRQQVQLSYLDETFAFEFVALDYMNPAKNQYAYQLVGFDNDWVMADNRRFASYTNLDPGSYTFRVKGANNHGYWNEAGATLAITITPPWWQTWWAYALYILLAGGSILGYVRYRTQAQAQMLAHRERELTQERLLTEHLQRAERLQAESLRQAIENENRLTQFLDAMPVNVLVVDAQGKPYYANQQVNHLMQMHAGHSNSLTMKQLLGNYPLYKSGTKHPYPIKQLPLNRALRGETVTADDIEVYDENKRIALEVWARPIYNGQGEISYAIAAFQDITERKQVEKERLQLSAIQHELSIAQAIQQSLLPRAEPTCPGFHLASHSLAAREVGGDWYTYHTLKNQRFAVAVGDVSGKGIPAALLMAVSLASYQAIVKQNLSPAKLLTTLDKEIKQYTQSTYQNCAMCYVELNLTHKTEVILSAANAGCIPPYIKHHQRAGEWIEIGGLPLGTGLGAETGYQEKMIPLSPGDMIIMTSDGVVEATTESREMFGFERLTETIENGPTTTAQAMLEHIQTTLATFTGEAEPSDDLTIVVLQV